MFYFITLSTIFTPMARVYSFTALPSTASVCLIPVICKCEIHFQMSIHRALNDISAVVLDGT